MCFALLSLRRFLLFSPVLVENGVCRLGLVLQSLLVNGFSLLLHPLLLQLQSPGQVQGGRPGSHAFTEDVGVQGGGVRVITRLEDKKTQTFGWIYALRAAARSWKWDSHIGCSSSRIGGRLHIDPR